MGLKARPIVPDAKAVIIPKSGLNIPINLLAANPKATAAAVITPALCFFSHSDILLTS